LHKLSLVSALAFSLLALVHSLSVVSALAFFSVAFVDMQMVSSLAVPALAQPI